MAETEHLQMVASTISDYAKGASDETIRDSLPLAMLNKYGKVTYNHSGKSMTWQVKFSKNQLRQVGDAGEYVFNEAVKHKQCSLDWRGCYSTDKITEKQRLMNRGPEALINLYATKGPELIAEAKESFCAELFGDGNATGHTNSIHGFESCLAERTTPGAGDIIAEPGDSYAGLVTNLGNYGGTWSSARSTKPNSTLAKDWPYGNSLTPEYDFFSPKLFNASSTGWPGTGTTWADNCGYVLRAAIHTVRNTTGSPAPTLVLMGVDWYTDLCNLLDTKFRTLTPHEEAADLGFKGNNIQYEGAAVMTDFYCPSSVAYGFKTDTVELCCMYDDLFYAEGPTKDFVSNSYLFRVGFFGNMKLRPRHLTKIKEYA